MFAIHFNMCYTCYDMFSIKESGNIWQESAYVMTALKFPKE